MPEFTLFNSKMHQDSEDTATKPPQISSSVLSKQEKPIHYHKLENTENNSMNERHKFSTL